MQTYVVGVQTLAVQPALPPPASGPKRHIYCDLAVRSASCHALYTTPEAGSNECVHSVALSQQSSSWRPASTGETCHRTVPTHTAASRRVLRAVQSEHRCLANRRPVTPAASSRRSGSAMRHFLDGEEAPQEYDVHLWEAAVAAPKQQVRARSKRDLLASFGKIGESIRAGSGSRSGLQSGQGGNLRPPDARVSRVWHHAVRLPHLTTDYSVRRCRQCMQLCSPPIK